MKDRNKVLAIGILSCSKFHSKITKTFLRSSRTNLTDLREATATMQAVMSQEVASSPLVGVVFVAVEALAVATNRRNKIQTNLNSAPDGAEVRDHTNRRKSRMATINLSHRMMSTICPHLTLKSQIRNAQEDMSDFLTLSTRKTRTSV